MCDAARSCTAKILIGSADPALSQSRKSVIEQHPGWEATFSRNKQQGIALLHSGSYDVLLLCNSLSAKTRIEFAELFRGKNPEGRIIVIEGRDHSGIAYDAVLPMPASPQDLISTIAGVLKSRCAHADD